MRMKSYSEIQIFNSPDQAIAIIRWLGLYSRVSRVKVFQTFSCEVFYYENLIQGMMIMHQMIESNQLYQT